MNSAQLLSDVRIASPCRARWEDMEGDERSRFCAQCRKHVYNLSAMSADEAANLIQAKEGQLCARFYRRRDGRMLTANCPVGRERYVTRLKRRVAAAVGLFLTSLGLMAHNRTSPEPGRRGAVMETCDSIVWRVKGWLGIQPPVMGVIMVPLPPGNTSGNNGNSGN